LWTTTLCDYVHLNPARAKLLRPEQKLRDFAWSSWPEYLKSPEQRPRWLRVDRLLGELHIPKDSVAGRAELENYLEVRRAQEDDGKMKKIRRGWCLGSETFRQELLAQAHQRTGDSRVSKLETEAGEQNEFNLE
jgi:putative transposase